MKNDNKEKLLEMMGKINPDFDNNTDWAIFNIRHGQKQYLTQVNNNDSFGSWDVLKYTDKNVLKFTQERAKELIKKNKYFGEKYGIVNGNGIQIKF